MTLTLAIWAVLYFSIWVSVSFLIAWVIGSCVHFGMTEQKNAARVEPLNDCVDRQELPRWNEWTQ